MQRPGTKATGAQQLKSSKLLTKKLENENKIVSFSNFVCLEKNFFQILSV